MPLRKRFTILLFAFQTLIIPSLHAQISFTRHTINNNLAGAYWVYAFDIDQDGDLDLATAAFRGLDWWENNGRGGFGRHSVGSVKSAWSVSAAELTGDNKIDLVGGSTADKEIVLFENSGGGFRRKVVETNFQDPESIVAADFDGDGDNDLLSCAVNDGVVAWWENRGGRFVKHHIDNLSRAHAVFAADLNRDGKIDAIASGSGNLRWYRNDGRGNFARRTVGSKGAWGIHAGDVDGDGDLDILRTQRDNGDVDWFENSGSGSFSEHNIQTGYGESWSVVSGDVDGDGDADVVAAGYAANNIKVWFNKGRGSFDKGTVVDDVNTARAVWAADLDRDGDDDIAAAIRGDRDVVWYEANGKASSRITLTLTSPNGGETLTGGSGFDVRWTSSGNISGIDIEFSSDNGSNWTAVKGNTRDDGKYGWTVPDISSDRCLLRVSDAADNNPRDTSDGVFTIVSGSGGGQAVPQISSFDPTRGPAGANVTIAGSNLSEVSEVAFGGTSASFSIESDTKITARVPTGAASGRIQVANSAGSAESSSDFVVTAPGPTPGNVFLPTDDARVKLTDPGRNFGDRTTLRVDAGRFETYLKFSVTGLSGAVTRALIRLYVVDGGTHGGSIHVVSNNFKGTTSSWHEGTLTFSNAPGIDGPALSTLGQVNTGEFVEFDVTSAIGGDGVYNFGLKPGSTNRVDYSSKEGDFPPQLIIETKAGGGNKFSLSVSVEGGGNVSLDPAGGVYDSGTRVTLTATPDAGFDFSNWTGDLSGSTSPSEVITMDANKNMTAVFKPKAGGGGGGDLKFTPLADAYVKSSRPGSNYGSSTVLRARQASTIFYSYLKFDLTGISAPVQRAVLRLTVTDPSVDGGTIYSVSNNFRATSTPWTESGLTWDKAPGSSGNALDRAGEVLSAQQVDFDVSAAVRGNGIVSFCIKSASNNSVKYSSREGARAPILLLTLGASGGNQPPVARDDEVTTDAGVAIAVDIFQNDFDPDGSIDKATLSIVSLPDHGSANFDSNLGMITYTPNPNYVGDDQFSYRVKDDSQAISNDATVLVHIKGQKSGGGGSVVTFSPTHDGQVKLTKPGANYGSKVTAKVEDGRFATYLKFSLSGIAGAVKSATLRLNVAGDSKDGGSVYLVSNDFRGTSTPWNESTLTAGNAPSIGSTKLASMGSVITGQFVEMDVTSAVAGNGIVSFALASTSSDQAKYETKEGDHPPELTVSFAGTNAVLASGPKKKPSGQLLTAVDAGPQLPEKIELRPNFPNPFNAGTTIEYGLPETARVKLTLYNLLGQKVKTLVDATQSPGFKSVKWDGRNQQGLDVGSGLYFVRLEIGQTLLTRQIALEK